MDHFQLNYGAINMVLTPEGEYVFLEVNPYGDFFWLEEYTKLPITQAIGNVLLGKGKRR